MPDDSRPSIQPIRARRLAEQCADGGKEGAGSPYILPLILCRRVEGGWNNQEAAGGQAKAKRMQIDEEFP
jgi:hypothetical protein